MRKLLYGHFCQYEGFRWFWSRSGGNLYKKNMVSNEVSFVCAYKENGCIKQRDCGFDYVLKAGDRIVLIPRFADGILIWDTVLEKETFIPLPETPILQENLFLTVLEKEDEIVLIPQTYQGIVSFHPSNFAISIDQHFAAAEKDSCNCEDRGSYIFRASYLWNEEIIYLVFYNKPQVYKYNYRLKQGIVIDSVKIRNGIEEVRDNGIRLLIFDRLNCVLLEDEDVAALLKSGFLEKNTLIYAVNCNNKIYFFTNNGIFEKTDNNAFIGHAKWYHEIKTQYLGRTHMEYGDRLQDTLYIFKSGDELIVSFEYGEEKCIITLRGETYGIEVEKIREISGFAALCGGKGHGNTKCSILQSGTVGKRIYDFLV